MKTVQKTNEEQTTAKPITTLVQNYLREIDQYRTSNPAKYLAGLRLLADTVEDSLAD